jgi:hypothetical protein
VATNPYLSDQANAITNQVTGNLQNRVLPNLNMGSAATGNFGSNRHMIAQGQAIGDTNQGLSNSLANLYGNAYAQDQQLAAQQSMHSAGLQNQYQIAQMNDATQRQGLQNQYNLGMGNLGLGYGNLGLGYTQAGNQFTLGREICAWQPPGGSVIQPGAGRAFEPVAGKPEQLQPWAGESGAELLHRRPEFLQRRTVAWTSSRWALAQTCSTKATKGLPERGRACRTSASSKC